MSRLLLVTGVLIATTQTLAQPIDGKRFCLRGTDATEQVCFPAAWQPEQGNPRSPAEEAQLRAKLEGIVAAARERLAYERLGR
jgi:hypothetical protein